MDVGLPLEEEPFPPDVPAVPGKDPVIRCDPRRVRGARGAPGGGDRAFRGKLVEEGELRSPRPPSACFRDGEGAGPSEQGGWGEPAFEVDLVRFAGTVQRVPIRGCRESPEGVAREGPRVLEPGPDESVGRGLHPPPGPHVEDRARGPENVVDQLRGTDPAPASDIQTGVPGILRDDGVRIAPVLTRDDQMPPFFQTRKAQGGPNRAAEGVVLLLVP